MLKVIALVVVGAIAIVLIFAATRPDSFLVQRATDIKAPPEVIFAHVNDFKSWAAWSPYEKLDPTMTRSYGGADNGKGATYAWTSDGRAGAGGMEIIESAPPSKIALTLQFTKPFKTNNVVTFTFVPQGDITAVTWAMEGPMPFVAKVMGLIFSMDSMVGGDFEAGLADLKKLSEQ